MLTGGRVMARAAPVTQTAYINAVASSYYTRIFVGASTYVRGGSLRYMLTPDPDAAAAAFTSRPATTSTSRTSRPTTAARSAGAVRLRALKDGRRRGVSLAGLALA